MHSKFVASKLRLGKKTSRLKITRDGGAGRGGGMGGGVALTVHVVFVRRALPCLCSVSLQGRPEKAKPGPPVSERVQPCLFGRRKFGLVAAKFF